MAHPYHHARSSVKKWGGEIDDYLEIHRWFDASKAHMADFRHRALRHHAEGIFAAEEKFGVVIRNSAGREVPVRAIGEQHVVEDMGRIPSLSDWFECIKVSSWMYGSRRSLEKELDTNESEGADADVGLEPVLTAE